MNPQEQLDQNVVNLAKAIRSVETGGAKDPFKAKGGSQEHGAYQFTKGTWDTASQKYLGRSVALDQATREEQNEVAYKSIKELKDKGYNVGQIASVWNSGKPDAYLDPNYKGVNKFGVKYDVPAYAKSVAEAYQSIKGNGQPTVVTPTASTVGHTQYGTPEAEAAAKQAEAPQPDNRAFADKLLDNKVTRGIQKIFPGKKVGEAIGTLGGFLLSKNKENYDTSAPSPLQVAGDVAQGALTVGGGLPAGGATSTAAKGLLGAAKGLPVAKSAVGRIAQGAALGAGISGTGAIANGKNVEEVAKETAIGGVTGGAFGTVGEILSKAAQTLPKRFLRSTVGKINDETAEYAVKKGLGSPSKMLRESEATIRDVGDKLGAALKNPKYNTITFGAEDIVDDVIKQYPDAELTPELVLAEMKKLAKLKSGLVTKLERGERLTLKEVHSLNSELGGNTFKTVFDDPAVKAGKQIGSSAYHAISNRIKTVAPETAELFETLSKEYPLRKALTVAINQTGKHKAFNLRDLMAIIGGSAAFGPLGGAVAFAGEKLLTSPSANMAAGGLIGKLGGSTGVIKPLVQRSITGGVTE